jgi:hypothetical protein
MITPLLIFILILSLLLFHTTTTTATAAAAAATATATATTGSTALGGPWPPRTNVTSNLYAGHPPANYYNPVSLCLLPLQSILI